MTSKKDPVVEDMSSDEQEYLERTALLGLEYVLADFAREFQSATRRWERIVWPAMIIFSLLAVSGFWLIYSITEDMHLMSKNIDPQMSQHLGDMSDNIAILTENIQHMDMTITQLGSHVSQMNSHVASIDGAIENMRGDIKHMSVNMSQMNQSIHTMTWTTGVMSEDMSRLQRDMGKPMRFMNNFLP
jgi:methyl-accepting chemotaxis protein